MTIHHNLTPDNDIINLHDINNFDNNTSNKSKKLNYLKNNLSKKSKK